ncbi:DsrE/DsrF/TusD sulfur relay family protein [Gallibacterium melopsittaci]|uniref:DsrE/DsrF/TusD sulfur relay family protein n=1 Tax=Gallibacterium melopsittaci TaxID=516063 RepID=A0ABV6HYF3_9PAST
MQKLLYILNDSPYSGEKTFNALRFALALKEEHAKEVEMKIFCFSDAVLSGLKGQNPKEGANVQELLTILTGLGVEVKLCTTCTNARAVSQHPLIDGVTLGTLADVAEWTLWADKVLTF